MIDVRSPLAVKIISANPDAYRAPLAPGDTPPQAHALLDAVRPEQLLTAPPPSPVSAHAMLAGLWLWHDGLEECRRIAQKSPEELDPSEKNVREMTSTLAFWHAIMHRREGDFSNSKYWYARAANHPVLATLAATSGDAINRAPADKSLLRIIASGWNPGAFVDMVEAVHDKPSDSRHGIAVQLQQMEWRLLFDHCARG